MRKILFLILATFLVSCGSNKLVVDDVPIRKVETVIRDSVRFVDSLRITTIVRDSIQKRDSVILRYDCDGKLLEREYYSLVERYNDKTRDYNELKGLYAELESTKSDSIPILVEVERKLSRWEQFKVDHFASVLYSFGALFLIGLGFFKFRRLFL